MAVRWAHPQFFSRIFAAPATGRWFFQEVRETDALLLSLQEVREVGSSDRNVIQGSARLGGARLPLLSCEAGLRGERAGGVRGEGGKWGRAERRGLDCAWQEGTLSAGVLQLETLTPGAFPLAQGAAEERTGAQLPGGTPF